MNVEQMRNILQKYMYHDTAEVLRSVKVQDGYVDDFEWQTLYEGIACHLAQYGKTLYAHRDDRSQKLTADLRLCCAPDVDIRANDVVRVERGGQTWELVAGEAFRYPTHKEISLRRRKEAGQT